MADKHSEAKERAALLRFARLHRDKLQRRWENLGGDRLPLDVESMLLAALLDWVDADERETEAKPRARKKPGSSGR